MSDPSPLPYAHAADRHEPPLWGLFRLGIVIWSACILVRHATWWGGTFTGTFGGTIAGSSVRSMVFAGLEAIVLILLLIATLTANRRGPVRLTFLTIGALCGAYLFIVVLGFAFEIAGTPLSLLHLLWMLASRVQIWVIPLMGVLSPIGTASHEQ